VRAPQRDPSAEPHPAPSIPSGRRRAHHKTRPSAATAAAAASRPSRQPPRAPPLPPPPPTAATSSDGLAAASVAAAAAKLRSWGAGPAEVVEKGGSSGGAGRMAWARPRREKRGRGALRIRLRFPLCAYLGTRRGCMSHP
jgi:hypothetical protein